MRGKVLLYRRSTELVQDHPRLCGEKFSIFPRRHFKTGSPPPMRGKDEVLRNFITDMRITPAYAGKSLPLEFDAYRSKDHPRLCGEKTAFRTSTAFTSGSPPPMRGKAPAYDPKQANNRITPAYAGKRLKCPLVRVPF